jgi:hypothetical protein
MSGKAPKTTKPRAPRAKASKLDDTDFSPHVGSDDDEHKQPKPRAGRPAVNNNNNVVKSRLALIIDILSSDDSGEDLDEKTLRRNVNTSLKHLKEVVGML